MIAPKEVFDGRIVVGDRRIQNAQVVVGATSDGTFYRTAILCRDDQTESIDIISAEGVHLGQINICGHGEWPSIEIITAQPSRLDVLEQGHRLIEIDPILSPSNTTTIIVMHPGSHA